MLGREFGFVFVPQTSRLVTVLIAAAVFQGILLLGALRQGRRAGDGDSRAGLGVRSIRHGGQVALLCVVMIIWLMAFLLLAAAVPALREFAKSVSPDVLAGMTDSGPTVAVLSVLLVVALAPVSEELFFRGWLWEALRRRGFGAWSTAGLTVFPWLLLHGIDAPGRILFLIPAAMVFSFARHRGGGVLASLAVHVTNNTAAVAIQAIAAQFGQP